MLYVLSYIAKSVDLDLGMSPLAVFNASIRFIKALHSLKVCLQRAVVVGKKVSMSCSPVKICQLVDEKQQIDSHYSLPSYCFSYFGQICAT